MRHAVWTAKAIYSTKSACEVSPYVFLFRKVSSDRRFAQMTFIAQLMGDKARDGKGGGQRPVVPVLRKGGVLRSRRSCFSKDHSFSVST